MLTCQDKNLERPQGVTIAPIVNGWQKPPLAPILPHSLDLQKGVGRGMKPGTALQVLLAIGGVGGVVALGHFIVTASFPNPNDRAVRALAWLVYALLLVITILVVMIVASQ